MCRRHTTTTSYARCRCASIAGDSVDSTRELCGRYPGGGERETTMAAFGIEAVFWAAAVAIAWPALWHWCSPTLGRVAREVARDVRALCWRVFLWPGTSWSSSSTSAGSSGGGSAAGPLFPALCQPKAPATYVDGADCVKWREFPLRSGQSL